jgi:hypothetical protein
MKSDNERIEEFLKGIVLPEYKSDGHARQLRAQILSGLQASRAGSGTAPWWKTAALLLGLLGAVAVAAESFIQARHYYFEGRAKDGSYIFTTRPENVGTNREGTLSPSISARISTEGDLDAAGIEQKRKDLEEIDALRQRNARELVGVADTKVNGNPPFRVFRYKYVLADGRTWTNNEGGSDKPSPAQLEADRQEIAGLRQRGQREVFKVSEVEFGGQRERMLHCRYVLSDGRAVIRAERDPEQPGPVPLTIKQKAELGRLASLQKGEFLGSAQVRMLGRTVTLQRYSFTLSDGTVVTRSEAQLEASTRDLSAAQRDELHRLSAAHKGETLGTYEEDVTGKPFKFTRVKYVLSDGTEVIRSSGEPTGKR